MDPNQALTDMRQALCDLRTLQQKTVLDQPFAFADAADELANAFEALDRWLSRGGFLPRDWQKDD